MSPFEDLVIIIPAFNEEKTIGAVLKELDGLNVFIVNDNSCDDTINVIKKYNFDYITNKENLGYEGSINKAFNIVKHKYKFIATLDADGELSPTQLKEIYINNKTHEYDILIGERNDFNRMSESLLSFYYNLKYGIFDPLSGMKIYKSEKFINDVFDKKNQVGMYLLKISLKRNYIIRKENIIVKKRIGLSRYGGGLLKNLMIIYKGLF